MNAIETAPRASLVSVGEKELHVRLTDGRTVSAPLSWFPRLLKATAAQRGNFRIIARGEGIHWPDVDEDLSIAGLLAGWHAPNAVNFTDITGESFPSTMLGTSEAGILTLLQSGQYLHAQFHESSGTQQQYPSVPGMIRVRRSQAGEESQMGLGALKTNSTRLQPA